METGMVAHPCNPYSQLIRRITALGQSRQKVSKTVSQSINLVWCYASVVPLTQEVIGRRIVDLRPALSKNGSPDLKKRVWLSRVPV
jgi:hypothetical protein